MFEGEAREFLSSFGHNQSHHNSAVVTDPKKRKNYRIKRRLGSGSFGNVYEVTDDRGNTYALKEMENKEESLYEVHMLHYTRRMHYVMHMHSHFEVNHMYYIVLEFFKGGDLENAIKHLGYRQKSITVDKTCIALKWIFDAMRGLKEMHQANFVHNDIKGQNIMIEDDTKAVLGDLGLTQSFTEKEIKEAEVSGKRLAYGGGTEMYVKR